MFFPCPKNTRFNLAYERRYYPSIVNKWIEIWSSNQFVFSVKIWREVVHLRKANLWYDLYYFSLINSNYYVGSTVKLTGDIL